MWKRAAAFGLSLILASLLFTSTVRGQTEDLMLKEFAVVGSSYDLDVGTNDQPASYLRKVIHHEFFHVIDYCDDGLLYEDDGWKSLNRPD